MVDPVLAFFEAEMDDKVDWGALRNQERFSYSYVEEKIMLLPVEAPLVHSSASGVDVQEGGHTESRLEHSNERANCVMTMKRAQ